MGIRALMPGWDNNPERSQRAQVAVKRLARAKIQCPNCKRKISANAMAGHQVACDRNMQTVLPAHHGHCVCGRMKPLLARCCWKCETKTEDFARLDALISASKIDRQLQDVNRG